MKIYTIPFSRRTTKRDKGRDCIHFLLSVVTSVRTSLPGPLARSESTVVRRTDREHGRIQLRSATFQTRRRQPSPAHATITLLRAAAAVAKRRAVFAGRHACPHR